MLTTEEQTERASAVAVAQLSGAALVAGIVTLALLVTPTESEAAVARYVVAALIGLTGYLLARHSASSHLRAALFGLLVLVAAVAVAALQFRLSK